MRLARNSKTSSSQPDLQGPRFLAQDGHARFHVRRLQLRRQAPFEARNEAVLEIGDLRSRPIAGKDDLFVSVEKRVEGVKEFFLRALLSAEKLNIVDQEQIRLPVALAELHQVVVLNRIDELVDEQLAR